MLSLRGWGQLKRLVNPGLLVCLLFFLPDALEMPLSPSTRLVSSHVEAMRVAAVSRSACLAPSLTLGLEDGCVDTSSSLKSTRSSDKTDRFSEAIRE